MAIGASFGRMVGIIVEALHEAYPNARFFSACAPDIPCITPGTYAFLGAGAALSGIMHITVSVVVIMFELTGALTYILPTMVTMPAITVSRITLIMQHKIVVGVTKAVSDRFGRGGIADRMIWFNGFPFLDNKEDHIFGVPVSQAMTTNITTLTATGLSLTDAERTLDSSPFQGFPIIESGGGPATLVGLIGRTELRYALDRAKRDPHIPRHATCVFAGADADVPGTATLTPSLAAAQSSGAAHMGGGGGGGGGSSSDDGNRGVATPHSPPNLNGSTRVGRVDLSRFVDATPLAVHPRLPLETAMELFKKLGPRVILVEHHGRLLGLLTVKDCLRYQFVDEAAAHEAPNPRDDAALLERQERLWGLIRAVALGVQARLASWSRGRIVLNEPEDAPAAGPLLGRGQVEGVGVGVGVGVDDDDDNDAPGNGSLAAADGTARAGTGSHGPVAASGLRIGNVLELEERFPLGGTGGS